MGVTPTLSQVENWDIEHLNDAAKHWTGTANVWEDRFTQLAVQILNPGGHPWEGAAAEAAQFRAHTDKMTVIGLADLLHNASAIAKAGALELAEKKRLVLRTVESAKAAGFTVGEDFSVKDPHVYNRAAAAMRQAQAEGFAADLRATVADLVAADDRIATEITTATEGLAGDHFAEAGGAEAPAGDDQKAVANALLGNMAGNDKPSGDPGGKTPANDSSPTDQLREYMTSGKQPVDAPDPETVLGDLTMHPRDFSSDPKEPYSWKPTPTDLATGAASGIAGGSHDAAVKAAGKSSPGSRVVGWTKELELAGREIPGFTKVGGVMSIATTPMGLINDYTEARGNGASPLAAAGQAVAREGAANAAGLAVGALFQAGGEAVATGLLSSIAADAATGAVVGSIIPGAGTAVGLVAGVVFGGIAAFGASKLVGWAFHG